ncbi:MAG: hypothetical protein CL935_02995 [Deltaproteobacteria bacterium]|nr:hypothetical protein [Deltaproteobacteria bacterium]|tara:strand:+ start:2666 stop:3112 length:447 start_codon:yes stop_codon:yes gene_type:complete
MEVGMNWLKKTFCICYLSLTIFFSVTSSASSETLEIVFKNSLWGSAIGGVSGVALWALQDEDKEDKFFPKYVVKGMAIGLFAGMAVGIFEAQTDSGIFMSNGLPKGLFHLDINPHSLSFTSTKIIPKPDFYSSIKSPKWNIDLLTAAF